MRILRTILIGQMALGAMLCATAVRSAQQTADMPRIENAKVETRPVTGSLEATLHGITAQAEKPQWVGYSVDQIAGERSVCCGNYRDGEGCGTCNLEKQYEGNASTTKSTGSVKLEGARQLVALFRLESKQVMRIRVASEDCTLDAGGLPFEWLTGVKPAESVGLLATYVRGADFENHGDHGIGHGALTAIALHGDASADQTLESFVTPDQRESLRRQAAFWMGARQGWIDRAAADGEERSEFGRACPCRVRAFGKPRSWSGRRHDPHGARRRERSRARAGTLLAGAKSGKQSGGNDYWRD